MSWDAIIVGGGCAGLAAATSLAESGAKTLVIERRTILGGRASSFRDEASGEALDNGQHLFLGCYEETQRYLRRIGSTDQLRFTDSFSTSMVGPSGERAELKSWSLPAPWHLAGALLGYEALSLADRIRTVRVARSAARVDDDVRSGRSVSEWLERLGQSPRSRSRFWDLLTLATLNIAPDRAPAELLAAVLRLGFLSSRGASAVGLSSVGLSDLHGEPSRRYITTRNGEVRCGSGVCSLRVDRGVLRGVNLADGTEEEARSVICAVPPPLLRKIVGDSESGLESWVGRTASLHPSSILSLHLWTDAPPFEAPYLGMWDMDFHWAFRKAHHVSLVKSAADKMIEKSKDELKAVAQRELSVLAGRSVSVRRFVAVREREATWVPPLDSNRGRLPTVTPLQNFYLAGDWTDTGLPATIEGAVLSGHRAARHVLHEALV